MEINKSLITYRKYNYEGEEIDIPILLIKKGTLLFRYVYDIPEDNKSVEAMLKGSFLGIKTDEDKFCLPCHYNVFFYPYPYIMDTNKYLSKFKIKESQMVLFETTQDINVALLLSPSELTRIGKDEENEILTTCNQYNYCGNLKGFYYDACFKEEFLNQNIDVLGCYGISENDSRRFMNQYKKPFFKPFSKFIHFYKDSKTKGVPELVLYPRNKREMKSIELEIREDDIYDYITENQDLFNYKMIESFEHKPYSKNDMLFKYLHTNFKKEYKFNNLNGFYERI